MGALVQEPQASKREATQNMMDDSKKREGGRSPKYMRLAIRHTRWSAGWPGDAIGRVPLYTKESRCQVIAPVRFEVCLAR